MDAAADDGPADADEEPAVADAGADIEGGWQPPPEAPDSFGDDAESLEPGSPTAENTLFVLLGALTTVLAFARMLPFL